MNKGVYMNDLILLIVLLSGLCGLGGVCCQKWNQIQIGDQNIGQNGNIGTINDDFEYLIVCLVREIYVD